MAAFLTTKGLYNLRSVSLLLIVNLILLGCNAYKKENVTPDNATYLRLINLDKGPSYIFSYNGLLDGITLDSSTFTTQTHYTGNLNDQVGVYKPNGQLLITSYYSNILGFLQSDFVSGELSSPLNNIDLVSLFPAQAGLYSYGLTPNNPSSTGVSTSPEWLAPTGYFPNITNRVAVGTHINGINFYKWAALPAGLASLRLDQGRIAYLTSADPNQSTSQLITGKTVLQEQREFTPGQVSTLIIGDKNGQKVIMSLPEPTNTPFKPDFAYLRFANITDMSQLYADILQAAQSMDVYLVQARDSLSQAEQPEILIGKNLQPFVSPPGDALPYVGIDMSAYLNLPPPDTSQAHFHLPAYEARFYLAGQSAATGNMPFALLDINRFVNPYVSIGPPGVISNNINTFYPNNPLLAWTKDGIRPLIRTILFQIAPSLNPIDGSRIPSVNDGGHVTPAEVKCISYDLEPVGANDYYYK